MVTLGQRERSTHDVEQQTNKILREEVANAGELMKKKFCKVPLNGISTRAEKIKKRRGKHETKER